MNIHVRSIAVAAMAIVLVLAGLFIGISSSGSGWSLSSAGLAIVVALFLVIFAFAVQKDANDGEPMPESQRRFLALYLVGVCVVLVYLVFAAMAVRFPDIAAAAAPAPSLPASARPPLDQVVITQIAPSPLRSDLGAADLQIFGYNFTAIPPSGGNASAPAPTGGNATPEPAVIFRSPRTLKTITDQLLIVSLTADDLAHPGEIPITVVGANGARDSSTVRILDQTGELNLLRWHPQITREMQLLLLVVVAGALGSFVHAIRSLTAYIGNQQAVASWFWFYVTKPFLGVALAVVFYAAIRGGFVAGSPADVKSVNPFGVFAIAALVGMFADKAGNKLAEIFDALFRSASERQNPISNLAIATAALPGGKASQPYSATIAVTGGEPPYTFSLLNAPAWLAIDPTNGKLSGTPPAPVEIKVELTVVDAKTSRAANTYTLKIEQ